MTSKERKAKEARLDEVVLQAKSLPVTGDETRLLSLRNEAFVLFFELYDTEDDLSHTDGTNYVLDVFESTMRLFDPSKGVPYTHYVNFTMKRRKIVKIPLTDEGEPIAIASIDAKRYDSDGSPMANQIEDRTEEDPEKSGLFDSLYVELTSSILHFAERHTGRSNNAKRLSWYKIFYTEDMTYTWKMRAVRFIHERDVFSALDSGYLDYYMSQKCRKGEEVAKTPLKKYEDVVPAAKGNKEETPVPLPADVSIAYLNTQSFSGASRTNRSNYMGDYRKETHEIYAHSIDI